MSKRILTILALISSQTFAQTSGSMLSTDLDTSRILERIKPDVVSHFSIITGPATTRDSNNQYNADGELGEGGQLNGWHQISVQYQLTKKTRFVINPRFAIDYNKQETNNAQPAARGVNPVMGITSTWYQNGNFSFSGGFNTIFANVERGTQEDGLIINPGGFETVDYKINNRLSVGSWLWGRYMVATNPDKDDERFPFWAYPYIRYNVTDNFYIQPNFEYRGDIETIDTIDWQTDDRFNFQFSYTFNKYITVQPMVTVFRAQDYNLAKGNLNFWVFGSF